MFQTNKEALEYLRRCDKVVVPKAFTYWCHSSQYKTGESESIRRGVWSSLPTDSFEMNHNMSFLSRTNRLQYVGWKQSFEAAPTGYTPDTSSKNLRDFQIKVMLPKTDLSLEELSEFGKDKEYQDKLKFADRGLGDGRHPKLPIHTKIHLFAQMDHDEMSHAPIDTVIGVREEDLICYANAVEKELSNLKENNASLEASEIEMPLDHSDASRVGNKRETLILGDNIGLEHEQNKNTQHESDAAKDISVADLESKVNGVLERVNLQKTNPLQNIDRAAREDKLKDQILSVRSITNAAGSWGLEGRVKYPKYYSYSAQKTDTAIARNQQMELIEQINKNADALESLGPDNYKETAIIDYLSHVKALSPVIEKMEQRQNDLLNYETFCKADGESTRYFGGRLKTRESVEVEKKNLLFSKKETVIQERDKNSSELRASMQEDLNTIQNKFARKEMTQEEFDACKESILRLYGEEIEKAEANEKDAKSTAMVSDLNAASHEDSLDVGVSAKGNKAKTAEKLFEENLAMHPKELIEAGQKFAMQNKAKNPNIFSWFLNKFKNAVENIREFNQENSKSEQEELDQQQSLDISQEALEPEEFELQNERVLGRRDD